MTPDTMTEELEEAWIDIDRALSEGDAVEERPHTAPLPPPLPPIPTVAPARTLERPDPCETFVPIGSDAALSPPDAWRWRTWTLATAMLLLCIAAAFHLLATRH
jgi:hypothetical protein